MGTWGVGVFSDDTAADVRDEYRDCLAQGMDGAAATDKVLALFGNWQDDMDDGPPFWLSLAATQFRYGTLEDRVRDRAIEIIDAGTDLARFAATPKLVRARERVLKKLRAQLIGPQRRPVKVRPEVPSECDWEPGEVVGYKHDSGEWIPLHVQGIGEMRRSRYPIVCVLDTTFEQIREANRHTPVRRVFHLSARELERTRWGPAPDCFVIFGIKKRDLTSDRIRRTARRIEPRFKVEGDGIPNFSPCTDWKHLDPFISEHVEPSAEIRRASEGTC